RPTSRTRSPDGHAHPEVRIRRRRLDHRHRPATPAARPLNSSPERRKPSTPPPSPASNTQTAPALTDPATHPTPESKAIKPAHAGGPPYRFAHEASDTGSPRRQARPPGGAHQANPRHRPYPPR